MALKTFFIGLGIILIITGMWYVIIFQKTSTQGNGVVSPMTSMTPLASSASTTTSTSTSQETPSIYAQWKVFTSPSAHISFEAPLQGEVVQTYGGNQDVHVRIGPAYYQTLGITGTTSIMLDVAAGTDNASTAIASTSCDTTSMSARTGAASSTLVIVGGQPFYDVQSSDEGMSQYIQDDRYVQIHTNGSCRFIDIRIDTADPGVYTADQAGIAAITHNNERVHMNALKQLIFDSIRVE